MLTEEASILVRMRRNYVHDDFYIAGRHLVSVKGTWGSGEATHVENLFVLTNLNEEEIASKRRAGKRRDV